MNINQHNMLYFIFFLSSKNNNSNNNKLSWAFVHLFILPILISVLTYHSLPLVYFINWGGSYWTFTEIMVSFCCLPFKMMYFNPLLYVWAFRLFSIILYFQQHYDGCNCLCSNVHKQTLKVNYRDIQHINLLL